MDNDKPIYVTQPYLPPLEELIPYLEKIWDNKVLTNGRHFHQQLEKALCEYLGVEHIALFANGTIALVTAFQALRFIDRIPQPQVNTTTTTLQAPYKRASGTKTSHYAYG